MMRMMMHFLKRSPIFQMIQWQVGTSVHILKNAPKFYPYIYIYISAKAQEMKAMAEQGLNAAKDKCKVQ